MLVVGDLNINLLNPFNNAAVDDFINEFVSFSYLPYITNPTRFSPDNRLTKFSLLDHVWSNMYDHISYSCVVDYQVADHCCVVAAINPLKFYDSNVPRRKVRCHHPAKFQEFYDSICCFINYFVPKLTLLIRH